MNALGRELAAVARAYAQVLFLHSARLGAVLLLLTMATPAAGLAGLLAVITAHATAAGLGYRQDLRHSGAFGYNAALLGLYFAAGRNLDLPLAAVVVLAAAASVLLCVVLGERLHRAGGLPVLVLPFVLLAIALHPALPEPGSAGIPAGSLLPPASDAGQWWSDALHGLAAVFCLHGEVAGACVFALLLLASRLGAIALGLGVAAALATAALLHVPAGSQLATALVYNGALTGLSLGAMLLVPGRAAMLVALLGTVLASLLCISMTAAMTRLQLPVLSAPFALVTLAIARALSLRYPGRPPFATALPGAGPEANLEFVANMAQRFGAPGVPEFALPFASPKHGQWIVSQGVGGEHTHRGAFEHAWDFEIVDARGFPFDGDGASTEDYRAFAAPVLAAAAGTVALVHDGDADSAPGGLDAARPWGNAVVLQHGPQLFSLVAHLRCGSVRVVPGQPVARGEVLGACGASGRSPRPHLHFQVQRAASLGAPAVPARFCYYRVASSLGVEHCRAFGVPGEGERLAPLPAAPLEGLFRFLVPGAEAVFAVEPAGTLRLASEISPLGERWLRDLDRGDRLYFVANAHEVVFTTHDGPPTAPLRALLLALPRLPHSDAEHWSWTDAPPASAMLSPPQRLLRAAVRWLSDPFTATAELQAQRAGEVLVVDSSCRCGWRRRPRPRARGRVELDRLGPRLIELAGADGPPYLRLRRCDATHVPNQAIASVFSEVRA